MPITLDGQTVPLPNEYAPTLLKNAFEASVIAPLTASQPLPLGDTIIPQYEGGIEAGWVGEGEPKPVSTAEMTHKTLAPRKVATIVVVSKEMVRVNPGRMLDLVNQDLQNAITRAIDLAILYGIDAKTGNALSNATYVNETTHRVELDLGEDLVPQVLAGYDLAGEDYDPTGFTFDTRMRTRIVLAQQQDGSGGNGARMVMPNLNIAAGAVAGLPATYGRVVSGRVGNNADTGVKGFVGDWNQVRWGFGETINMSRSDQATVVDGDQTYHLWQDNLIGLLVEAIAGWVVMDKDAFAAYEQTAEPEPEE